MKSRTACWGVSRLARADIEITVMMGLGVSAEQVLCWFPHESDVPHVLIRVSAEDSRAWAQALAEVVRRCYVTDELLEERSESLGVPPSEIAAATLPEPGSTMSGDFGEILVFLYQGAKEHPLQPLGALKWRLKQDRTKPITHSDVVHLVLPSWPRSSDNDAILCSEVKTKATSGQSTPVQNAIADIAKDQRGRLTRTLVWLRERALTQDLGDLQLAHLERFINATDHPPARRRFRAVAVVCASLVEEELHRAPIEADPSFELVVISVPELRKTYSKVFEAALQSCEPSAPSEERS